MNLARLITEQVEVEKDQDHISWVLMNQPEKVVDRTEYLLGKVDVNPGEEIARLLGGETRGRGLRITNRLVQLMGGRLEMESGDNRTTPRVILP